MARLGLNIGKYFTDIIKEHTELDMNKGPEVNSITDPAERKEKAKSWLESRITQLNQHEALSRKELTKVYETGIPAPISLGEALEKCLNVYDKLRAQANQKYQKVISTPIASKTA